jgi:hypothetical protein
MSSSSRASQTLGVPATQLESSATFDEIDDEAENGRSVLQWAASVWTPSGASRDHPARILGTQSKVFGGSDEARARRIDWVVAFCGFVVLVGISLPPFIIRYGPGRARLAGIALTGMRAQLCNHF